MIFALILLVIAVAMPMLAARLLRALSTDGWRLGLWSASAGLAMCLGALAFGCLGPDLVDSPKHWMQGALAIVVGATPLVTALVLSRAERSKPRHIATAIGLFLGVVFWASGLLLQQQTRFDDASTATPKHVSIRAAIEPWDGQVQLALAWEARRGNELDHALEKLELARDLGAPQGPSYELEAEVHALRDDCESARAAFDRALVSRAQEAINTGQRLELGGYELPETLVRKCELGSQAPTHPAVD